VALFVEGSATGGTAWAYSAANLVTPLWTAGCSVLGCLTVPVGDQTWFTSDAGWLDLATGQSIGSGWSLPPGEAGTDRGAARQPGLTDWPLFRAGMLFMVSRDDRASGELRRVDLDGADLWEEPVKFDGYSDDVSAGYEILISAGRVYLQQGDKLLAVDSQTGRTEWSTELGPIDQMCLTGDGQLAVSRALRQRNEFVIVEAWDGTILVDDVDANLQVCGQSLIYAGTGGGLLAYSGRTAPEPQLWAAKVPLAGLYSDGPIVTRDGRIFFVTGDYSYNDEAGGMFQTLAIYEAVAG
jgi:outer membrane protein assembly factor BamB